MLTEYESFLHSEQVFEGILIQFLSEKILTFIFVFFISKFLKN